MISGAISVGPVGDRVLPPCGVVRGVSLPVMSIPGGGSLFNRVLRFSESVCMKSFIVGGQRGARTGAVATEVLPTVVATLFFFTFFVFSALCRVYLSYRFCLFRSQVSPFASELSSRVSHGGGGANGCAGRRRRIVIVVFYAFGEGHSSSQVKGCRFRSVHPLSRVLG